MPDQTQDPNQGMTFDAAPVQQDTPVAPAQNTGEMTFDSTPVQQDTPVTEIADPMQGASAEERAFLKANPDHAWVPSDPKFPNRPAGIYPTGKGNEWRSDPEAEQHPIDLHMLKHIAEGAAAGATVAGGAMALPALTESAAALYNLAVRHLAGNVLPGMEEEAAKQKLLQMAPKVLKAARDLSIGAGGMGLLWKAILGGSK